MTQTRLSSLIEACFNILIGGTINFVANLFILPSVGLQGLTLVTNLYITLAFTVISIVRQYAIRRWFNRRLHAAAMRLAGGDA